MSTDATPLFSRFWSIFNRKPAIVVLRLSGVIAAQSNPLMQGSLNAASVAPLIERAFSMPNAKAVLMLVNSPGGAPAQTSLIAQRIRALAEEKNIPVIAFIEDVAASGGYWLACAADEIYAEPSSIVGSIGVISAGFGFEGLMAKLGVERRLYTSGERKSFLDPFGPEREEDIARLGRIQKAIHGQFIAWVKNRRGAKLNNPDDPALWSGEFWTGEEAAALGLIDGVRDARGLLRERFGASLRIIRIDGRRGFFRFRRLFGGLAVDDLIASLRAEMHWRRFGL